MDYHLKLHPKIHQEILNHLLPERIKAEEAAFCFVKARAGEDLECLEWYGATHTDFAYHSLYHIELKDECRARVIKRAHDLKASIVEFHSHPYPHPAEFSGSDRAGFREFVPHVWWRLKSGPYAAIVVAPSSFDSLIWANDPHFPSGVLDIVVEHKILRPTALSWPAAAKGVRIER